MQFQKSVLWGAFFTLTVFSGCTSKIVEKPKTLDNKVGLEAVGLRPGIQLPSPTSGVPSPGAVTPTVPPNAVTPTVPPNAVTPTVPPNAVTPTPTPNSDSVQAPCVLPGGGTLALSASQTRSVYSSASQTNCTSRSDQTRSCSLVNHVSTLSAWTPSTLSETCIKTAAQRILYRYSNRECALSSNQKIDQNICDLNGACLYESVTSPSSFSQFPNVSCAETNNGGEFCSGAAGTVATNPCVINQLSDLLSIKSLSQSGSKVHFKLGANVVIDRASLVSAGLSEESISWSSECQAKTLTASGLRLPAEGILGSNVKSFDGAGKSLILGDVNFKCPVNGNCGVLFGQLTNAQVKDLTVKSSSGNELILQSEASNPAVGFIVGSATDSKFNTIRAERLKVIGDSNQGTLGAFAGQINSTSACSEFRGIIAKDLSVEVKGLQGNVIAGGVVGAWSGTESCRTTDSVELRTESSSQAIYRDPYFATPLDPKQRVLACGHGVNVTLGGLMGSVSKLRLGRSLLVQLEEKTIGGSAQFDRNLIVHNKAIGTETGDVEKGLNVGAGIFFGSGNDIDIAFNPSSSGVNFFGSYIKGTYNVGAVFGRLSLRHFESGMLTANLAVDASPEAPCPVTNNVNCVKHGIGIGYANVRGFMRVGGFAGRVEALSDNRKVSGIMVLDSLIQSTEPPESVGRNASFVGGIIGQVIGPSAIEQLSSGGNAVVAEYRSSSYGNETNFVATTGAGGLIGSLSASVANSSCSITQSRTFEGFGYLSFPGSSASLKNMAYASNYAGSQHGSVAMASGKKVGGLIGSVECPQFVSTGNTVRFLGHISACEQVGGSIGAIDSTSASVANAIVRNVQVRAMSCPMGVPIGQDSRSFRSGPTTDLGGVIGFAKDLVNLSGANVRNVEVAGEYGVGGLVGRSVHTTASGGVPTFRGNTVIRTSAIGSMQVGAGYGAIDAQVMQMNIEEHTLAGNLAVGSRAVGGLIGYANASFQGGLRLDLNSIRIRSDRESGSGAAFNYSAVSEAFRPVVAVRNDPAYSGLGGVVGGFGGMIGVGERVDFISVADTPHSVFAIEAYLDYRNAQSYYLNALPGDLIYPDQNTEAQILNAQPDSKFHFLRKRNGALWCPNARAPEVLAASRIPGDAVCAPVSRIGRFSSFIEWMNGVGGQGMLRAIDGAGLISGSCGNCTFANLGLATWDMSRTRLSIAPSRDTPLSSPSRVTASWISSAWSSLFGRSSEWRDGFGLNVDFPGVVDGVATNVNRRFHSTLQGRSFFLDIQTYSEASVVRQDGNLESMRSGTPENGFVDDLEE